MFGRRILGGPPDGFKLLLGYQVANVLSPSASYSAGQRWFAPDQAAREHARALQHPETDFDPETGAVELHSALSSLNEATFETAQVAWTAGEADEVVLTRLKNASVIHGFHEEKVFVRMAITRADTPGGAVSAANFDGREEEVQVNLAVELLPPKIRRVELSRTAASGAVAPSLILQLLLECELEGVTRLRCAEGMLPDWDPELFSQLEGLRILNLSSCQLSSLPAGIGALTNLRELRVSFNKLSSLSAEVGSLRKLHRLIADGNLLTSIPGEIRRCAQLRELSLEANRLSAPVIDLRALAHLRSLQLFGNPLEFLPELTPCSSLRHLSLANVRIRADPSFTKWDVEIAAPPTFSRVHKLAPLFGIIFRRSSCQHPVLAGALGKIAEDAASCAIIAREVGAVQQLILMALSDSEVVVQQACKILGLLGRSALFSSDEMIQGDVLRTMLDLICSLRHKSQLAGLGVLAGLAMTSPEAARKLLSPKLHQALAELVRSGNDDVKIGALETLGNLAFQPKNRAAFMADTDLLAWISRLAQDQVEGLKKKVSVAAIRALAILGQNDEVWRAVGRPGHSGRGVRILAMDGGGMKGMAIVRLLKQIELRTQRRIYELFDLICGTSTGGILAVAIALKQLNLEQCEEIYRSLGQKVFSRPGAAAAKEEETGWKESLYKFYKSGQQSMRVAVYGCKHDAGMFEELLKEYCLLDPAHSLGNTMIDSACLNTPKCFVVSTLVSMMPANPFIFRNYELPPKDLEAAQQIKTPPGSSSHQIWQAVRASSAAPYYLDDFKCGNDRFQDGAASANNPAALALSEARLLWPDAPIDCLLSLGSGSVPLQRREKSMSAYLDIGSVLIESACSVDRIDSALATVLPLVPGLAYFRFCCEDPRCGIELDEIDPEQWALLEAATDEYIEQNDNRFGEVAALLLKGRADLAAERIDSPAALSLGAQRQVLVLEAVNSTDEAAAGMRPVDEVTSILSALPFAERCSMDVLISADASTSQPSISLAKLEQHLCSQDSRIGAVHLGMQLAGDSFILQWSHVVDAAIDPGSQAAAILEAAALPPEHTLSQLWAEGRDLLPSGAHGCVKLLGLQSQLIGSQRVVSVLHMRSTPSLLLPPAQLQQLAGALAGRIITVDAYLTTSALEALLGGGCRVVVCQTSEAESAAEPSVRSTYFATLYQELHTGSTLLQAMNGAEAAAPSLQGYFGCWQICDGVPRCFQTEEQP